MEILEKKGAWRVACPWVKKKSQSAVYRGAENAGTRMSNLSGLLTHERLFARVYLACRSTHRILFFSLAPEGGTSRSYFGFAQTRHRQGNL